MRNAAFGAVLLAAGFCLPIVPPAAAQEPVTDFRQLNTRLVPGDAIWVTDAQGREVRGKILSLDADALVLEGGGRRFGAPDVKTIAVRRNDSLRNGALIGLGVGGGLAAVACFALGADGEDAGWCAAAALIYAGMGAGIGAGIDALIPGKKLVAYRAPGATGRARLSVAPVITPRAKGVAVSFAF